jgi:N-acetylglutamate synthase-like GNAT family acetyltransferase
VVPEWRNRTIGRTLLAQVKKEFSDLNVYVLSDVDAYYEKLGYGKVGSVFEVPE